MTRPRRPLALMSPASRTRVGNGSEVLPGIDGRSQPARRLRELIEALSADLGPDLTAAETLQVRNAAALQLSVEALTVRVVNGETVGGEEITRAANAASRALSALKVKRTGKARSASPDALQTYLAEKAAREAAA